jgi:uncharacterized protein YyaL (SSP411 family)
VASELDHRRRHAQPERHRRAKSRPGSAVFTGDENFRAKADRLIAGVLSEGAENLFARISILNAADLRIGGAEIVVAGADAGALTDAALKLPCVSRVVLRAPAGDQLSAAHPAREKIRAAGTGAALHLRRADLFAARHDRGRGCEGIRRRRACRG